MDKHPTFSLSVETTDNGRVLRVICSAPAGTKVEFERRTITVTSPIPADVALLFANEEWPSQGKRVWLGDYTYEPAEIGSVLDGVTVTVRRALRHLAENAERTFTMKAVCDETGISYLKLRAGLAGILGNVPGRKHWFFDTRYDFRHSGQMEYRMREREAAIVRAWFEAHPDQAAA
jgi:hypothetical protein